MNKREPREAPGVSRAPRPFTTSERGGQQLWRVPGATREPIGWGLGPVHDLVEDSTPRSPSWAALALCATEACGWSCAGAEPCALSCSSFSQKPPGSDSEVTRGPGAWRKCCHCHHCRGVGSQRSPLPVPVPRGSPLPPLSSTGSHLRWGPWSPGAATCMAIVAILTVEFPICCPPRPVCMRLQWAGGSCAGVGAAKGLPAYWGEGGTKSLWRASLRPGHPQGGLEWRGEASGTSRRRGGQPEGASPCTRVWSARQHTATS